MLPLVCCLQPREAPGRRVVGLDPDLVELAPGGIACELGSGLGSVVYMLQAGIWVFLRRSRGDVVTVVEPGRS